MIFRSNETKNDPTKSWNRSDKSFFAAGACHILAYAFLEKFRYKEYEAILIKPHSGFRGTHLFVSNSIYAFDWRGYSKAEKLRIHYFQKMKQFFEGWNADLIPISNEINLDEFCEIYRHRKPNQFLKDPLERAHRYLSRFNEPS